MTDGLSLVIEIQQIQPDEIYNLADKAMFKFFRRARVHS